MSRFITLGIISTVLSACLNKNSSMQETTDTSTESDATAMSSMTDPTMGTTTDNPTGTSTGMSSNTAVGSSSGSSTDLPGICGDGVKDDGEECDSGRLVPVELAKKDECTTKCKVARCGNGDPELDDECDDGNNEDADACTNACKKTVCGDGNVQAMNSAGVAEQCDDGNDDDTDACAACQNARCGDGHLWAGVEECDDGAPVNGDGCTSMCKHEYIMFVTSSQYDALFNDVAGADKKCADAAKDKLPGTYVAWISTNADLAQADLPEGKPLVRRDGKTIVDVSGDLLTTGPLVPISFDENGDVVLAGHAWTGTTEVGGPSFTCTDWTSNNTDIACVGDLTVAKEKSWTADASPGMQGACNAMNHLYCFRTKQ